MSKNDNTLLITTKAFTNEVDRASKGYKTSLPFIIHDLPKSNLVKQDDIFQVIVLGGSVCKNAILKKQDGKLIFIKQTTLKQSKFITKNDFFSFIKTLIDPQIKILALNFAYPIRPVTASGKLDGVLISGTKENTFLGLEGQTVGEEIEKYIFAQNKQNIKVCVANDTVCLLLSGLTQSPAESLAAGVVGTGLNFAFFIDQNRLVNMESANFDKFTPTNQTLIIDKNSSRPGKALFEKETSGAYLYQHFNLILKEKGIPFEEINSTERLNDLIKHPDKKIASIAKALIIHSGEMVACQIAGILNFKKQDMTFVMEGSLFYFGYEYKRIVEQTLNTICSYKANFIEIQDSAVKGAAKLVA